MAKNFYFAWVDGGVAFNPAVHNVVDEDVFSFSVKGTEGDCASMELVIKNPRIGLLNPGRKRWAFLSINKGTDIAPVIQPMFYGRLLGIPDNIFSTLVTLHFTARPTDFALQKSILAAGLRSLPEFDPIFVSPDLWNDADVVLEARTQLWHVDPVTLTVSVSDVLVAEDGVIDFAETEHFYDDVSISMQQVPLRSVTVDATIPWTQTAIGAVDFTPQILEAFGTPLVSSFTFQGLASSWPKQGTKIGSGWEVTDGFLNDVSGTHVKPAAIPDIFYQGNVPIFTEGSVFFPMKVTGKYYGGEDGAGFDLNFEIAGAILGYGVPRLFASYTAGREMAQVVKFTMKSNQQATATEVTADENLVLSLTANKVSDPTRDGSVPIGDLKSRDYTHTFRGDQSVKHLLLIARAHLIIRSRCVKVGFVSDMVSALNKGVSLRKSALVHDGRIPGAQALGKFIEYEYTLDGSTGAALCKMTIACAVGNGGSYTSVPGTPNYVDTGYVDREWQEYKDELVAMGATGIQYKLPPVSYFDDGLDFVRGLNSRNALIQCFVTNKADAQEVAIGSVFGGDQAAISGVLQNVPTQVHMQLVPMEGGPFTGGTIVTVSDLVIPKQIDLEAPSSG